MDTTTPYLVFVDEALIAEGTYATVFPVLRRIASAGAREPLVFDATTGRQVDFDLRSQLPAPASDSDDAGPRGRGRPKLGVTSREVTLMPRHWEWLAAQPSGISAAIRRLVEQAMKDGPGREKARRIREAVGNVLGAVAGNRPNFEEATRALYAADMTRFETLVAAWPPGIRDYAIREARAAVTAETSPPAATRAE